MEGFLEIFNSVVESGGVELILTAAGLPMAAAGVGIYRKMRKAKKLKEAITGGQSEPPLNGSVANPLEVAPQAGLEPATQ